MADTPQNPDSLGKPPSSESKEEKKSAPEDLSFLENSRDQLSEKLSTGPLQVEKMEASDELQRRRRQMKASLMQVSGENPSESTEGSAESAFEEESGGLMALLKEAKITRKHLRFCLGALFLILLGGALIWGGIKVVGFIWDWATNEEDSPPSQEDPVVEEPPETPQGNVWEVTTPLDESIFSGVLLGVEEVEQDLSVFIGELLGSQVGTDDFTLILQDFSKLYHALQVDVNDLLNVSKDRQATLDEYIDELEYLEEVSIQNVENLLQQNEMLSNRFSEIDDEKDLAEVHFFEELEEIDPFAAGAALDEFIALSQESVDLRAQYLAREKILEYYETLLELLELKILAITLNEEALVKGIQVVDIPGIDLDLIIEEPEF